MTELLLVQTLAFVLPVIATLCVLTVICVNIYFKIRRKFPVSVNCWFCNQWTKVHYDSYNSFYCSNCLQYNGFNEEGGYNKVLPEQHDELLNQQVPLIQQNNGFKLSNGLCHICNNNQKLKVYQLANFVPLNEDCFDVEVEHFQKQLEKAYKLCPRCDAVVKSVITKQNTWLLGTKLKVLKRKGLSLLDLNKSTASLSKQSKRSLFQYFLNTMLILFASLVLLLAACNVNYVPQELNKSTLNYIMSYGYSALNSFNNTHIPNVVNFAREYLNISGMNLNEHFPTVSFEKFTGGNISDFSKITEKLDVASLKSLYLRRPDLHVLCTSGLFFQTTSMLFNRNFAFKNVKLIVLWCCLLATVWYKQIATYPSVQLLQILASAYIVYTFFKGERKSNTKQTVKIHRRRENKVLSKSDSPDRYDLSDNEEDFTSNHSATGTLFNSTLKPNVIYPETDSANSDCSFYSTVSRPQNLFKEPAQRVRSPLASYQIDHAFGKPPNFACHLSASPVFFGEEKNANNNKWMSDKSCASFKDVVNTRINSEPITSGGKPASVVDYGFNLNESLHNLHLGKNSFNIDVPKKVPIKILRNSFPRPILSPPKLTCLSRNSWLSEDGFWKNVNESHADRTNFSSSSSQSSGFASQSNDNYNAKVYSAFSQSPTDLEYNGTQDRFYRQNFSMYRTQNGWTVGQKVSPRIESVFQPIQSSKIYNDGRPGF